jgi:hypothetical protein
MHDPDGPKGGPEPKRTPEQVAHALDQAGGLKSVAAHLLGVEWHTVARAVKRWPGLQAVIDRARERTLDEAELSLRKLVREGNLGAICFTLKCQGKKRGWVERPPAMPPPGGTAAPREIRIHWVSPPKPGAPAGGDRGLDSGAELGEEAGPAPGAQEDSRGGGGRTRETPGPGDPGPGPGKGG